jgi:cytochrome P450
MGAMPNIQDFRDTAFNPFTAMKEGGGEGKIKNWYPELKRLREINPVFKGDLKVHFGAEPDQTLAGRPHVAIIGAREAKKVLMDGEAYSVKIYLPNLGVYFGRALTTMDNPEHGPFRRYFQKLFGLKVVSQWGQEVIPRVINRIIDGFNPNGRVDLVREFALLFPFHFIHELMGLPVQDRDIFHKLAFGQILITFDQEHGMEAVDKLRNYLTEMVLARRAKPVEGDFMSMVATAELDGKYLPDEVAIAFFRNIINAGGDTAFHAFSTILAALLTHPEQLAMVRKDRSLVPKAIEEGMRWDSPVGMISRTPVQPVELCGVRINPGDHIQVMLPAANRDPAEFPNPDAFDVTRESNHGAFGFGPHICIGRHLARLEMINALNALLDRLPRLRIDDSMPPPEGSGFMLRGPEHVYARFD